MLPTLHHETTRVPVTALVSCASLLVVAEGPFLRFFHAKDSRLIASKRVFAAQAIHGISVCVEDRGKATRLVVWGGRLVRALEVGSATNGHDHESLPVYLSNVVKASDWILDLVPRASSLEDEDICSQGRCAAVTAHNSLLELTIDGKDQSAIAPSSLILGISELTPSSRSILYSAHLLWESSDCIRVAAGTAFGEIMYWSWNRLAQGTTTSRIHQVFLGHEGSIFDVRISSELQGGRSGNLKRVIASCSDDRTIRLWDVSDVETTEVKALNEGDEAQRIRHTGFSIAATDAQPDDSKCLAIGWGHTSRVWKVRFIYSTPCDGTVSLLSAGEDATSRTWRLVASTNTGETGPCTLLQTDCAAYHSGKNLWSVATYRTDADLVRVACGAADSKLTTYPLLGADQRSHGQGIAIAEYTVQNLLDLAQTITPAESHALPLKRNSEKLDSIRSYCFLDTGSLLLVMNSGKVLAESFYSSSNTGSRNNHISSKLVDEVEGLKTYSTCVDAPSYGLAFVGGCWGHIYMYSKHDSTLKLIGESNGKIGKLFVTETLTPGGQKRVMLLVVVSVGQNELLYIDVAEDSTVHVSDSIYVNTPRALTGSVITSMLVIGANLEKSLLLLGFRRGSIGLYDISEKASNDPGLECGTGVEAYRIIKKAHGDESVNAMKFLISPESTAIGHLYSIGRDGFLAIHLVDFNKSTVQIVHKLALPIGPYVEDMYIHGDHLLVHGFSSKRSVLYDVTSEEEIMGVDTGGAYRSWAFQPNRTHGGGTFVWTRTSSLHICSQEGSNHEVLRSGGHGREIKAVAVSPPKEYAKRCVGQHNLIATGAEDTDIKIFQYIDGEPVCLRTLRKHTTGIQHLQWSDDGNYLFSSAGSEEFYIWRIRCLPVPMGLGVVCEHVYTPESEFSDLRIMSFDVTRHATAYTVAMVFSDSSVKIYRYDPLTAPSWQPLAQGTYFTSCLTQCTFLSPTTLLTAGTDGHAVLWPLSFNASQSSMTAIKWHQPARIHQNASKTMSSHRNLNDTTLIVSGGDDGALAFLLAYPNSTSSPQGSYASPPVLVNRAHGSAVTACTIVAIGSHVYVVTAGNDEWVRLWEVVVDDESRDQAHQMTITRLSKVKTSVADVSSMAVLDKYADRAKVLVCGVGMEVIRLDL